MTVHHHDPSASAAVAAGVLPAEAWTLAVAAVSLAVATTAAASAATEALMAATGTPPTLWPPAAAVTSSAFAADSSPFPGRGPSAAR